MAVQFFTLGLALGLLLAPRKGDETRALLLGQLRSYMQDAMSNMSGGGTDEAHHPEDVTRDVYRGGAGYSDTTAAGPQ